MVLGHDLSLPTVPSHQSLRLTSESSNYISIEIAEITNFSSDHLSAFSSLIPLKIELMYFGKPTEYKPTPSTKISH